MKITKLSVAIINILCVVVAACLIGSYVGSIQVGIAVGLLGYAWLPIIK